MAGNALTTLLDAFQLPSDGPPEHKKEGFENLLGLSSMLERRRLLDFIHLGDREHGVRTT